MKILNSLDYKLITLVEEAKLYLENHSEDDKIFLEKVVVSLC